jgi:acyl-coenzyme A thioesterase PaaI-like protein
MIDDSFTGPTLRAWQQLSPSRFGRWLFNRKVSRRAPYFKSIRPHFLELQPALCRIAMRRRRGIENHVGAVHTLAIGNLCELAAGMVTEVTIPANMGWMPRGMAVEYLRRAESDVIATARLDKSQWRGEPENIGVPVSVTDASGVEVVRAVITIFVSPAEDSVGRG